MAIEKLKIKYKTQK